jgi:hypothetical protein
MTTSNDKPNDEPLAPEPGPDAHELSSTQILVRHLFDNHPAGEFQDILRVGFSGMDAGDLVLAKACADHVLTRAGTGSGDMMRAMLLRAFVYERFGKKNQSNDLMNAVIQVRF